MNVGYSCALGAERRGDVKKKIRLWRRFEMRRRRAEEGCNDMQ